jgi:hypothetical protein
MNCKLKRLVRHPRDGVVTPRRLWAAWQIADNWRLHQRLPRLKEFGMRIGIIKPNTKLTGGLPAKED